MGRLIDADRLKERWTIASPEPYNTDAAEVLASIEEAPTVDAVEVVSDERLTTDAAIWYLESVVYEDFAPYTQKCLLNVIEAARKEESMTSDWEKRMERIVEKLEERYKAFICKNTEPCDYPERLGCCYDRAINDAIEIVKAGGVDATD